jgi:hypothetical protein
MIKMKKLNSVLLAIAAIFLIACSGSETYRGGWKATDSNGAKLEIIFDAKSFSVQDSMRKSTKFEYTQNSVNIKNSIATYGIQLGDGRNYQINFPKANDESVALVLDNNGYVLYTMSRKEYLKYEDVFKLK